MKEFETDIDAAKYFIEHCAFEEKSHLCGGNRCSLTLLPGDALLGNRGGGNLKEIGSALAKLRDEAGITPGELAIYIGDGSNVTIEGTLKSWDGLWEHVTGRKKEAKTEPASPEPTRRRSASQPPKHDRPGRLS